MKKVRALAGRLLNENVDPAIRLHLLRNVIPDTPVRELRVIREELKEHPTYRAIRDVRIRKELNPVTGDASDAETRAFRTTGTVFIEARKVGPTDDDPHVRKLVDATAQLAQQLFDERPRNDTSLSDHDRYRAWDRVTRLPGTIAIISMRPRIVKWAQRKAIAQVTAHYELKDFTVEAEDRIWPQVYGKKMFTSEALAIHRRMGCCLTEYPVIFDAACYRLVGHAATSLPPANEKKYCGDMLRRLAFIKGGLSLQDRIIGTSYERQDVFARDIATHLLELEDHRLFPSWRRHTRPFVSWLWEQQMDDGFWDFGKPHNGKGHADRLRLSRNWRSYKRHHDWTARVLLLMNAYHTGYC